MPEGRIMLEFWQAALSQPLAQNAVLAALLVSVACGVVGSYVVVRRITYIAAGVAHCVLGGMGAARYLQTVYGWTAFHPIYGAMIAALGAAAIIGWVSLYSKEREDSAISAMWSMGMAAGVLFIYITPGYTGDLMGYLFGNILLVTRHHLYFLLGLDVIILLLAVRWYDEFQAVCFDEEFARTRNINAGFFYILLLGLTALTVVALSMIVGIVLVIALLTLPAALSGRFAGSLMQMMAWASGLCALFCFAGLTLSYKPDLPAGPTIILIAGAAYFSAAVFSLIRHKLQHQGAKKKSARPNR
ncbi:MAG TPA: metal ABC transporter permease [Candidatus Hydrogenedentes bacterium]|nr:metal ABC transporter permease [Candidatus Hydrogenedentota bacterium]HOH43165.1 metal ABC transporter permease [Candidatus Hydrogenedentota bacterium]HPX87286.1 metal ABC transporter permease [Candidatus Hydrogenedentota bacterium]